MQNPLLLWQLTIRVGDHPVYLEPANSQQSKPSSTPILLLKIISLNCCSICSQTKRTSVATILYSHDVDIVLGCKSHLDPSYFSSELLPSEYTIYRKDNYRWSIVNFLQVEVK